MTRRLAALLCALCLWPAAAWAAPIRTVAYVYAPDRAAIERLGAFRVSFEETDRAGYARLIAAREVIADLRSAGFEVDVAIEDLDAFVRGRRAGSRAAAHAAPVEVPPTMDHYFTAEEVGAYVLDLAATHPDLVAATEIGQTVSDRPLYLVKLSDHVETNENEPAIFFEGTIHGDEIAAYMLHLHLLDWLVSNYGVDDEITALVDAREIFVVPLTNPDGNYDDPVWGRSRYNDNGVDLNRNNGYMWDPDESGGGASLHSEPETQALSAQWIGGQPFSVGVSGHGGSVVISLPWSYHYDEPADWSEFDYLGGQYVAACEDPSLVEWYEGSWGMYQMYGSTKDELYGSHGADAWTIEYTSVKECAWSKTAELMVEHQPAWLWLLTEMGEGVHGVVTDADTGEPLAATVRVQGKWTTFSDPEVGDFHKYLRPGAYNVTIAAAGHLPYTGGFVVAAGVPAQLDVQLAADPDPKTFAYRWIYSACPNAIDTHQITIDALGPPDSEFYPLGFGGWAMLDLGPAGIADGAGEDLAVYEAGDDGDEPFAIAGKFAWEDDWTEIGEGVGSTAFDLSAAGLAQVRYVRITDGAKGVGKAGELDGFDLDAVGTPAVMAAFTADPTTGDPPLPVQFTDRSTGAPTSWAWDFGDGETASEQHPLHTYQNAGLYTVSLTVNGPAGEMQAVRTDYINVQYAAPAAEFSGSPRNGAAPLPVQFADLSAGTIDSYAWDFGDGETSTEAAPLHTYAAAGRFTVALTVTGPGGADTTSKWRYINVTAADDDDDDDDDNDDDDDDDDASPGDDDDASPDDGDDDDDDDGSPDDDDDNDDNDEAAADDDNDGGCGC